MPKLSQFLDLEKQVQPFQPFPDTSGEAHKLGNTTPLIQVLIEIGFQAGKMGVNGGLVTYNTSMFIKGLANVATAKTTPLKVAYGLSTTLNCAAAVLNSECVLSKTKHFSRFGWLATCIGEGCKVGADWVEFGADTVNKRLP
jgi:hypothetical protein